MPLVFSPLSEAILESPPRTLLPKHAFIMRQLGNPPTIDLRMNALVKNVFENKKFKTIDANGTTGSKDYLERILGLIRGAGFTVAIFSHDTRPESIANICLELGFAAMCGKPIIIVKSNKAVAPSDLKRTDWIEFEDTGLKEFRKKLRKGLDEVEKLCEFEDNLLQVALEARSPDCAVALERANKGFLLSGQERFIESAERILMILDNVAYGGTIADLERLRSETKTFIRQARAALPTPPPPQPNPAPQQVDRDQGRGACPTEAPLRSLSNPTRGFL